MARPYIGGTNGGLETITASKTLSIADHGKVFLIGTDALVITLPATSQAVSFTFINSGADANNIITISPNASDKIIGSIANAAAYSVCSASDDGDLVNTKATCGCFCKEEILFLLKRVQSIEEDLLDFPTESDMYRVEKRVDDLEDSSEYLENRVTDAEENISEVESKLDYIEEDVSNIENDMSIEMSDLEKLVGTIDSRMTSFIKTNSIDVVKLGK